MTGDRNSKRSNERLEDKNDNSPSEKRRDDRTTPVKLFPMDTDQEDSEKDTDANVADASTEEDDHEL
jgi:hypothetical protein